MRRLTHSQQLWIVLVIALAGYAATLLASQRFFSSSSSSAATRAAHSATFLDAHTATDASRSPRSDRTMALSHSKQRALHAVVAGFVADAATMGLHWIYDEAKLAGLVAQQPEGAEFFNPPSCPYYSYTSGALSPYGDEIFPLLQDVATRGEFDPLEYGTVSYLAAKAYTGRLNHIFKELVVKGDAGLKYPNLASNSIDAQGATKAVVLVARYLENTDVLLEKVREGTRVHQIGQEAEDAAVATALLLQHVILGSPVKDAIAALATNDKVPSATRTSIQEVLDDVRANKYASAIAATAVYGKSCGLPGVFKTSIFVLLTSNGYVDAIRANLAAGGDNCSRSIIIGAVSAAAESADPVPAAWKQKTTRYDEIKALAEKLVQ